MATISDPLKNQINSMFASGREMISLLTDSSAAATIVHQDGSTSSFPATDNTDAAAGTALSAAVAAAVSGDTINVFRNATVSASIAKDGVNWYIAPGVTVTSTAGFLFDDAGTAMSYTVGGDGILSATGGLNNQKGVVTVGHASSNVAIFCRSILGISSGGATGNGVWCHAGNLTVFASEKISADQYTIYWTDGSCTINAGLVECVTGGAGAISTVTVNGAVGDLYVTCDEIRSAGYAINSIGAGSPTGSRGRCWVTAGQIRSDPGAVTLPAIGVSNSLLLYVTCQKLTITADRANTAAIQADSGALLWFTAQKFTPHTDTGGTASAIQVTGAASSMWANIMMFDDSVGACSTVSAALVDTSTANLYYTGETMFLANAADGIKVTGGAAIVSGVSITTHAGNKDLYQTAGTLTANQGVSYDASKTSGTISGLGGITATPGGVVATQGKTCTLSTEGSDLTPAAATSVYVCEIFIPCNMVLTGVKTLNGAAVGSTVQVGLYTAAGAAIAGCLTAATTTSGGAGTQQAIAFAAPYRATGPAKYLLGFQYGNTSERPRCHALGTAFGVVQATVTMGTTAISPLPTTFTATQQPIASLY